MANGPFPSYAPPGVYTETQEATQAAGPPTGLQLPMLIGVGQETLSRTDFELVRGSSASVDQQITREDVSDRFVLDDTNPDNLQLGTLDGTVAEFQVRNYPIVTGDGSGTTTDDPADVAITIDGTPVSAAAVDGEDGVVTLQVAPESGSDVRITYFFNRTDTLATNDVSEQVTPDPALLLATEPENYDIVSGDNDLLELTVDGADFTLELPSGTKSAQDVANDINSLNGGSGVPGLTAGTDVDNRGRTRLTLEAQQRLEVGAGSANALFGFFEGQSTSRTDRFYVYNKPIVDGSNGGLTTTDPADVTAEVDGSEVEVASVDGTNGSVTLTLPPAPGSTVEITYWHNTWQDTFDHLPDAGIDTVLRVGNSPGRRDYVSGRDFVVSDDKLHWGASYTIESGLHTAGSTFFDDTQISAQLADNRIYLEEVERYVDTSVTPSVESDDTFVLGHVPTVGNGRDDVLTTELYRELLNDRTGVTTNRPELIEIYHGTTLEHALANQATITRVQGESRLVTIDEEIPDDHLVFATYWYNRLEDDEYTLEVQSGGDYRISSDLTGSELHDVAFGTSSATDDIEWPSGSETDPDAFIVQGNSPVNETVTVTFTETSAEPFVFTNLEADPYDLYANASDQFSVNLDTSTGSETQVDVDLDTSAFAVLVSDPIDVSFSFIPTAGEDDTFEYRLDDGTTTTVTMSGSIADVKELAEWIWRSAPNETEVKGTATADFDLDQTGSGVAYDVDINGTNVANTYTGAAAADAATAASNIASDIETASGSLTAGDITQPGNDFNVIDNDDDTISIVASESLSVNDGGGGAGADLEDVFGWDGGDVPNDDSVASYSEGTGLENTKIARTWEGVDASYILMRSRTTPASRGDISRIETFGGNANGVLGMPDYATVDGTLTATNKAASLIGDTFQDSDVEDLDDADVDFLVRVDGTEYNVPASDFDGDTTQGDAQTTIDNVIGGGGAGVATVTIDDGALRITSNSDAPDSAIEISDGRANQYLGFSEGDSASQEKVESEEIVAVINNHTPSSSAWADNSAGSVDLSTLVGSTEFLDYAYAEVTDGSFLTIKSFEYGNSETFEVLDPSADSALNDTGIGIEVGDAAQGQDGQDGFNVSSSRADGSSGSGVVGQTYTDDTTGLRFTVLPPQDDDYTTSDSFTLEVSDQITPNANDLVRAVPGVELFVDNTTGVPTGDTAILTTYDKDGAEPGIGDFYYVSYRYQKQDFDPKLLETFREIEAEYGAVSPENALTLGAFLAITNGAVLVATKQVPKQQGLNQASASDYIDALEELERPLEGGTTPDILVPLTTDATVQQQTVNHCEIESSPRRRQERRCILGTASGTTVSEVRNLAQSFESERAMVVYPDAAIVSLEDEIGVEQQFIVDGTYMAAALAGSMVSPAFDVASPVTRRRLTGFVRLNRSLSAVEQNRLAVSGVTVLEDVPGAIRVRDGLTTDVSNRLTSTPSVVAIKDFVQQQARATLDRFIGLKFLRSRAQDVELALSNLLNSLQEANIIADSKGVKAEPDPDDPTMLRVEAFYSPIFPLKYIQVTFTIRGS